MEEGSLRGGFGSAVLEFAADRDLLGSLRVRRLGVPDRFIEHATQEEQRRELELDLEGIASRVRALAAEA